MNKTFLASVIVASLVVATVTPVRADWLIDRSGMLRQIDPRVLGDETEATPAPGMTDERLDPRAKIQAQEKARREEMMKKKVEEQSQQNERRAEQQKLKTNYEIKNQAGILEIKGERQDLKERIIERPEAKITSGEPVFIEQKDEDGTVRPIKLVGNKNGDIEITQDRLKMNSKLELKLDEKNDISVTLPNGKMREISLPDKALERLVEQGIITENTDTEGTSDYELTVGSHGEPVYVTEGQVEKRIFGIFKAKFAQKLEVAASNSEDGSTKTGDIVGTESQETSAWRRFLERFATES